MQISKALINNVGKKKIDTFLLANECFLTEDQKGKDIEYILQDFLDSEQLKLEKLNNFLFQELFYGMHRETRIYSLNSFRYAKYGRDWVEKLVAKYNVDSLNFNKIVQTNPNREENEKIVAIETVLDDQDKVNKIKILFVKQIDLIKDGGVSPTYSYIPVEIDTDKMILVVKARSRKRCFDERHKHNMLMEYFCNEIINLMNIDINVFEDKHKEQLYQVSKEMVHNICEGIPGNKDIAAMDDSIEGFITQFNEKIYLEHKENGVFDTNVLNIENEIKKVLQHAIISDYFYDKSENQIFELGIEAILTYIRFNDKKNTTVRLMGENRRKHIFNSDSFMGLRNAIEEVESVEALGIAYNKAGAIIKLKYDATDNRFLRVLFYDEYDYTDFEKMWRIYNLDESDIVQEIDRVRQANFG